MRKLILICVLIVITGVLSWLISQSLSAVSEKEAREESIALLPSLQITVLDGRVRMLKEIAENQKTILILFNSECDHCRYETKSIASKMEQMPANTEWIFISEEPLSLIKAFESEYFGDSAEHVTFAQVDLIEIIESFKKVFYPNIFIYDETGHLIREFKGETKVQAIISVLDSNNLN